MKSTPTISQKNEQQFLTVLATLDPGLYRIKIALEEYGVNPEIMPAIIRTIGNLSLGTGFGRVQIFMQAKVITQIKPEETIKVDEEATVK